MAKPKNSKPKISHARLTALLDCDPATGIFRWKVKQSRRNHPGDIAGWALPDGYRRIQIDERPYMAHVLLWFYVYRRWANGLDHRNGIRDDNRLANLRPATRSQNCHNTRRLSTNTSGFKGVSRIDNKWRAQIRLNGMRFYLGRFATPEAAYAAYCRAAQELHGDYARLL